MNPLRYLPLPFLLPAWTPTQLSRFAITHVPQRLQPVQQKRQSSTETTPVTNNNGTKEVPQNESKEETRGVEGSESGRDATRHANGGEVDKGRSRSPLPETRQRRLNMALDLSDSELVKKRKGFLRLRGQRSNAHVRIEDLAQAKLPSIEERRTAKLSLLQAYNARKEELRAGRDVSREPSFVSLSAKDTVNEKSIPIRLIASDISGNNDQELFPESSNSNSTADPSIMDYFVAIRQGSFSSLSPRTTAEILTEQDKDESPMSQPDRSGQETSPHRHSQQIGSADVIRPLPPSQRADSRGAIPANRINAAESSSFSYASYLKAIQRNAQTESKRPTTGEPAFSLRVEHPSIDTKPDSSSWEAPLDEPISETMDRESIDTKQREISRESEPAEEVRDQHDGEKLRRPEPPPRLSLMEELFPETVQALEKQSAAEVTNTEEVPMLSLPAVDTLGDEITFSRDDPILRPSTDEEILMSSSKAESGAILVLEGANSDLSEDDIRRIATKGAHIDEWRGPIDPQMIIAYRDDENLSFKNRYLLVFKTPTLAKIYRARANYLHELARKHTPTSVESQTMPLPDTRLDDGTDIHNVLKTYTLAPPSQQLYLRFLQLPYHRDIQRLLAAHGTPALKQPTDRAGRAVILAVDGHTPSLFEIKDMLLADGNMRGGVHWSPALRTDAIELLAGGLQSSSSAPFRGVERHDDFDDDDDDDDDEDRNERGEGADASARSWLVTFEDETEARRFVRAWHQRPFPGWERHLERHDLEAWPVVRAEVAW